MNIRERPSPSTSTSIRSTNSHQTTKDDPDTQDERGVEMTRATRATITATSHKPPESSQENINDNDNDDMNATEATKTTSIPVTYTHLRAYDTVLHIVCHILLEK